MKTENHKLFDNWEITTYSTPKFSNPILIEGMPGIGNVGKISMDMLIEETKATLFMTFFSHQLPSSVFINHNNLAELPKLAMYHKKIKGKDYLFLTGDIQPITDESSHQFAEIIVDYMKKFNVSYIVTLGGIGLGTIPEKPKVYLTGNSKSFVEEISKILKRKKLIHERNIYGVVGPILGISGLLLGVSQKYGIKAYSLLSETFGHPIYVGLEGARELLKILNTLYSFGLKMNKLDKEIKEVNAKMSGLISGDLQDDKLAKYRTHPDVNYIG